GHDQPARLAAVARLDMNHPRLDLRALLVGVLLLLEFLLLELVFPLELVSRLLDLLVLEAVHGERGFVPEPLLAVLPHPPAVVLGILERGDGHPGKLAAARRARRQGPGFAAFGVDHDDGVLGVEELPPARLDAAVLLRLRPVRAAGQPRPERRPEDRA